MKAKTTTIRQTVTIPTSPSQVYDAFANPKKHSEFTGSRATGKPLVGGKFTAWDGYILGKYVELEEGKRIVQEWTTTEWPEGYPPSRLELTFTAHRDGTKVKLVQRDVPEEQAAELKQGWIDFYWEPLKAYFKKRNTTQK